MRVLIINNQPIVRHGLRELLTGREPPSSVGEAATASEGLEQIRRAHWDVVLLDIATPDRGTLDVLTTIRSEWQQLPILIMSTRAEDEYAVRLLKAGAHGYVRKDVAPEVLLHAIRKVAAGGRYVSERLAEILAKNVSGERAAQPHETLSDREYQVLTMIAFGKTPGEIAEELRLSVKTISTYRGRVLEKLHARTTADLVRYALEHHLLP